jgi:hypothetical protein
VRFLLIAALCACRSREAPPASSPPPRSQPPKPPAPAEAAVEWTGEPIAPTTVEPQPAQFALGNDVVLAVATPRGWLATRLRRSGTELVDDVVDERGVLATDHSARVVAADEHVYVVFERADAPTRVSRLDGRKLVPLAGEAGLHWAFDIGKSAVGIVNDTAAGLATQHWQTVAIEGNTLRVVESSTLGDYATGAARLGSELVVATREHDPSASTEAKAAALVAADHGNTAAFAGLVGQPRGWLLHVDASGHVTSREPFTAQTPGQLAVTRDGWLVIATEGTAATLFRDGVLLGRAPGSSTLQVLARDIELGSQLFAAGSWACLYTMPGETRVVHCVDPVRRLHVATPALRDNVALYGIEPKPTPHLLFRHSWYPGGYGKPVADDTLSLALP